MSDKIISKTFTIKEDNITNLLKSCWNESGEMKWILELLMCYTPVQEVAELLKLDIDEIEKKAQEAKEKEIEKQIFAVIEFIVHNLRFISYIENSNSETELIGKLNGVLNSSNSTSRMRENPDEKHLGFQLLRKYILKNLEKLENENLLS